MDQQLQELKRQASVSGDYALYDAVLARTGRKRIVMRQLTLGVFRQLLDHIVTTNWSHTNRFSVGCIGSSLTVDLGQLRPGYLIKPSFYETRNDLYRVFHIATKELILPLEFLERPDDP